MIEEHKDYIFLFTEMKEFQDFEEELRKRMGESIKQAELEFIKELIESTYRAVYILKGRRTQL